MGVPLSEARRQFLGSGKISPEEIDLTNHTVCKGACEWRFGAMGVTAPHAPNKPHVHLGSLCVGEVRCLECGYRWHTNTRSKGQPGSWYDLNDPSLVAPTRD